MLDLFTYRFKAVSNLFVKTYEGKEYTFPAPISMKGTVENEKDNTKPELTIIVPGYYDSILIVDYYFSLFFYGLTYEYNINTIYINNIQKETATQDISGYKGVFSLLQDDISVNIGQTEVYNSYTSFKEKEKEKKKELIN